jgi:hypothetical protein
MSSDLSAYLGNKIVRWLGGNAMPSAPGTIYLALFNGDPRSGGSEVTTTVDATGRKAIALTVPASGSTPGTSNVLTSSADTDFGLSDASASITHVAVFDASSSGNRLASKALAVPIAATLGTPVKFLAGDITFTVGA